MTGTVVLSWRDGRDDAARARVATYLTTSIDGGQTFSAQTYANPVIHRYRCDHRANRGCRTGVGQRVGRQQQHGHISLAMATQMGLAVFNGQIYPIWAGNLNKGHIVNGAVQGPFLSIFYQPMVIADGPRIVSSSWARSRWQRQTSGSVSFTVTFDRPIDPPSLNGYTTIPTFTPADVLVYYHDTTNGDPPRFRSR